MPINSSPVGSKDAEDRSSESTELKAADFSEEDAAGTAVCACCKSMNQDPAAKGYAFVSVARGSILMANVLLSSPLIYLASHKAGCVDQEENKIIEDCDSAVHGFRPAAVTANAAGISGLLGAFLTPVIGVISDSASPWEFLRQASFLVQRVQIHAVESSLFLTSILQAFAGFLFSVQVLAAYSYLPELARNVGGVVMNAHTKWFVFIQFLSQILFLLAMIIVGGALTLDTIESSQAGQVLVTLVGGTAFVWAWGFCLPVRPTRRVLPENSAPLVLEGFRQNGRTLLLVHRNYRKVLKWFMLATVFAESGYTALGK